eukprot:GHVN01068664.1.p3 GENE.GHVN01068664.1~~GHVN01068664.1.p3  ORF type:complete len:107 (-),score=7.41 GHVN01068664.1:663-983(-)
MFTNYGGAGCEGDRFQKQFHSSHPVRELGSLGSTQSGDESVENDGEFEPSRHLHEEKRNKRHVKSGSDRKPRNDYSMEIRLQAVERYIRGEWTDRDGIEKMGIAAT